MKHEEAKVGMRVVVKGTRDGGVIDDKSPSMFRVRYHGEDSGFQWHTAGMLDPVPSPEEILAATLEAFAKSQEITPILI